MKTFTSFLLIIIFFSSGNSFAQNFQWGRYSNGAFNNIGPAVASDVTSDFGMRNGGVGATVFHKGVDISPLGDQDVIIIAPFDGTITDIIAPSGSIKSLQFISNNNPAVKIALLHIFPNGALPLNSNGFRLEYVGNIPVIIDIVNCRAFSATVGLQVTCNGQPISQNNPPISTTNMFNLGWPIAPMGNSGHLSTGNPYPYHTHITQLENGSTNYNSITDCIDPMHDLRLSNISAPLVTRIRNRDFAPTINLNSASCEHNGTWGMFNPNYENDTRNVLEIELSIHNAQPALGPNGTHYDRYSNGFMNESLIEGLIRKINSPNYALIHGTQNLSKFKIDPRGADMVYPSVNYGGTYEKGGGCAPYAYTTYPNPNSSHFHPHDFYLFPDFYLRLHKSHNVGDKLKLATYPWDAKYSDGDYQITSQVTNIDGGIRIEPPVSFDIDNFKPFIRQVGVNFEQVGVTVYWNQWNETSVPGQLQLGVRQEGGLPDLNTGPLTVYAVLSEDMQAVRAQIPSLNTGIVNGVLIDPSNNKWRFDFGNVVGLAWAQCHKIIFTGVDFNANPLLDFQINTPAACNWGITKKVMVPKRIDIDPLNQSDGVNDWDVVMADGKDEVHRFRILQCVGTGCNGIKNDQPLSESTIDCDQFGESVATDIHYATSGQAPDGSVSLTFVGSQDVCITWYDLNRNQIGDGATLSNLLPGWYCYEAKLEQECCYISNCVEVGACGMVVSAIPHHPTYIGATDGSISLEVSEGGEPLAYIWNNGSTNLDLQNLGIGTYTVTVSDIYHCSAVSSISLIDCPAITVDANAIALMPSACDATDGNINLNTNSANGGVTPYSFHWEDDNGVVVNSGANDLTNLGPGIYCLVVVDAAGCTGSKCFNLIPDHYPILEETILPSCENQFNGSINVVAHSQQPGFYTFSWEDGSEDSGDIYSWREGLSSGTYCVTITSEENLCSLTRCYDVPTVLPDEPLMEAHNITNPCPETDNGTINLVISGGVEPYSFDWSDLPGSLDPKNRTGLTAGVYQISITDYCGASILQEFYLSPVSITQVSSTPGCANQGQAEISLGAAGNPPFTIAWSNGSLGNIANNLPTGRHFVSVTDAAGCIISNMISVVNKDYTVVVTEPCIGMSDGIITVNINNPNGAEVTIALDDAQVYSNLFAPVSFPVDISSLDDNTTYELNISIENCNYPTAPVALTSHPLERVFDHYDDPNDLCYYKDACKGVEIPGSVTSTLHLLNMDEADNISGGAFQTCAIPAYCGDLFVDNIHVDKKWAPAAIFRQILLQSLLLPFPPGLIQSRLDELDAKNLDDCDKVRYCPANMDIIFVRATFAHNQVAVPNGDDCYLLDCTPTIPGLDNNFCTNDPNLYPSFFETLGNNGGLAENCNPASVNVYQLILWKNDLLNLPLFQSSTLRDFIEEYENDPRAKCAKVVFCQNDYSVLYSDILTTYCGEYDWIIDYVENAGYPVNQDDIKKFRTEDCLIVQPISEEDCGYIRCANPHEKNVYFHLNIKDQETQGTIYEADLHGHLERICPTFPGHFLHQEPGNVNFVKNAEGICKFGDLVNFGKIVSDSIESIKGIFKCEGKYNYLDYSENSRIDAVKEAPNVAFFIDDWDSNLMVFVRNGTDAQSFYVEGVGINGSWSTGLTSTAQINVSYFEKNGNDYQVGGEFTGSLSFGDNVISTQNIKSGFLLRISPSGMLLSHDIIRNLESQKPLVFARGADGVHIVGRSTALPLTINGTTFPIQPGFLTDLSIGNDGGENVKSNQLSFDTSLTIVNSIRSVDNSRVTYLFRGYGNLNYGGEQISGLNSVDLILVTCNNLGNVLWVEKINGSNISGQDFEITYGSGNDVLIGIAYQNDISIQGQQTVSNGSTDILVAKFNSTGQLVGKINYGTGDSENISHMFFADGKLFFGGEFSGDTTSRKIGVHTFLTLSSTASSPYISFVPESAFTQEERPNGSKNWKSNSSAHKETKINIYPNPFGDDLTVRVISSNVEKISFRIYDGLGHLINEDNAQANVGENEYTMPTRHYPSGIYLIQVMAESGVTWNQKIVKN